MTKDCPYAAPTPQVLYIHDDLSDYVSRQHGERSRACKLTQDLLALLSRDGERVKLLTLQSQIARLLANAQHSPFSLAIGIGRAGVRVAEELHMRSNWFPQIMRIDITREEDGRGGYRVVPTRGVPLAQQLPSFDTVASLAVVDDTVFSGLTMRTMLSTLPAHVRGRTRAFCLRGVATSILSMKAFCPIEAGFAAPGRLLEEVSFINASGLVMRIGIRHRELPSQAFFERPVWMHAWFPENAEDVMALCRQLNAVLEPDGRPAQFP